MHTPRAITIEEFDQTANMLKREIPLLSESAIREGLMNAAIVIFDNYALPSTADFENKICIILLEDLEGPPLLIGWRGKEAVGLEWG